jgi:hypothetical protein
MTSNEFLNALDIEPGPTRAGAGSGDGMYPLADLTFPQLLARVGGPCETGLAAGGGITLVFRLEHGGKARIIARERDGVITLGKVRIDA